MSNIKLFEFVDNELILKQEEFALIPEFRNLLALDKEYGEGTAWQCFTYIYLAFDNLSPYMELTESDRLNTAYDDSGLNEDLLMLGVTQAACSKYISLQITGVVRMLNAAKKVVENLTSTLETMNLDERTTSGGLVYKFSDITRQIRDLADVYEGITKLEFQVRQEREATKGIRGDNEQGYKN